VKKNCGLVFVAYVYVIVAFGWSFLWSVALAGISAENSINFGYFFLMLLSFFFTHQVIFGEWGSRSLVVLPGGFWLLLWWCYGERYSQPYNILWIDLFRFFVGGNCTDFETISSSVG
jgi:hypothetical protein